MKFLITTTASNNQRLSKLQEWLPLSCVHPRILSSQQEQEVWATGLYHILTVTSPSSFTPLDILISYPRATCLHQSLQISYLFNILYFIYTLCFWGHQVSKKFCLTEWNILHNTQTSKFDLKARNWYTCITINLTQSCSKIDVKRDWEQDYTCM